MQSVTSIGRALYRIVFRFGSPQRIHYTPTLMGSALALCVIGAIASQRWFFGNDALDIILALFVGFAGLLVGASMLTWKAPRPRMLTALLSILLLLVVAQWLLVALVPVPLAEHQSMIRFGIAGVIGLLALLGISNCVRYALASAWLPAAAYTGLAAVAIALLFSTLQRLVGILYA